MDYRTGFASWNASGFDVTGPLSALSGRGFVDRGGSLMLDPTRAGSRAWPRDVVAPSGKRLLFCEMGSPEIQTGFPTFEAIPSWNCSTPEGSWIEVHLAAKIEGRWSRWYDHGIWTSSPATLKSRSPAEEADVVGRVSTDTLALKHPAEAFRLRVRLLAGADGAVPSLAGLALAWSTEKPTQAGPASEPLIRDILVDPVPAWSQMIHADGGQVWCSPTSLAMVMAYWMERAGLPLPDEGSFVRETASGVYDHEFEGHGNWSFNAAWAGEKGFVASVRRFRSLAELEPWIATGVPVVLSVSWNAGDGRPLAGAPVAASTGHLTTLVGFDAGGDPVMNEPAVPDDASVRRVYPRAELEARWLEASGGTAYIVRPRDLR